MSLVQRFTRDSASKYVWGGLLLLGILGVAFTFTVGSAAVRDERLQAERRAVAAVRDALAPSLEGTDLDSPIEGRELSALRRAVAGSIGADRRVARVAIWSAGGELLFSTDRSDNIGSNEALNDELLQRAASGDTLTRWNVSDIGGTDEAGRSLLRTYTPIRSGAVAEVDHAEGGTVGPKAAAWLRYRIVAGVVAAFFLLMTILSLRDPFGRIDTGVRFSPSAIPAGYALIDEERLHAVEEVYRLAHDRVEKLEARLSESEQDRRRLEGVLQRALTSASTGAARPPPTETIAPPIASAPAPASPPASVATPAARRPLFERADEPAAPSDTPAEAPKRRWLRRSAPVPQEELPAASVEATEAAPLASAPAPASGEVVKVPDSEVVQPEAPKRQRLNRKAERVAPDTTATGPDADGADAAAHEAALETFIRLTERDRQRREADDIDQGAVRAALARTAARKKPGGAKLQPHDASTGEVQGGGPRSDRS